MKRILPLLLLSAPLVAAEPKVYRDLAYAEPNNERQTLDVYAPAEGKDHPLVVWIHGGGWKRGDKAGMQQKPRAFTEKGFVFVSTNYRFVPNVTVKEMMADVAKAIRWAHDHAKEYGGDGNAILVMGHSAGAHLAALVCTDDRYLKAEGLSLAMIKGCVPVDVSVYDIPKRLKDSGTPPPETFKEVFGEAAELHKDLSPVTHIARRKNIPPFAILHVASRPETKVQSHWFADKLHESGIPAIVVSAEGKTHGTINSDLGLTDDKPTKELFGFLAMARPPKADRDLAYVEPKNERQVVDVYSSGEGQNKPVVFWIHGGGWQRGDKTEIHFKPQLFVQNGCVFASTNYRFVPNVTIKQMAGDIAKSIRWVHDHASQYGGDPNKLFVMGHSAGAQLAALVCTDDRYLKAEGLSLAVIKGCVPVDGDSYDVPLQIATVDQRRADMYRFEFGDPEQQKDLSSLTHVAKGKNIPPFLILHVADHPETKMQSERLVQALQQIGVSAKAYPAEGKNHSTLNADLGLAGDQPTKALLGFVGEALRGGK